MEKHLGGSNLNGYITSSQITKTSEEGSEVTQPTQRYAETFGNKSTPVDEYCVQLYYASLNQMIGEMYKDLIS